MNAKYAKLLLFALATLVANNLSAQQGDTMEIQRNEDGKVIYGTFKPDDTRKINNAASFLKQLNGGSNNDELRLTKEDPDEFGIIHRRYKQYYKGIPVEGTEYLAHGKGGIIETVNGRFEKVDLLTVQPSLSEAQALSIALSAINAKRYKWEDEKMEQFIKRIAGKLSSSYYPKGELVIAKDYKGDNRLKLAWKFIISSLQPNGEDLVVVNAITGEIMNKRSVIDDANVPLTAQTRYSGTLTLTGDSYTGGYRLRETRNSVTVQTLNAQAGNNYAAAIDFSNTNTNFTNGSWPAFTIDQVALDAHWGHEMVLDYFKNTFNHNSIDNAGLPVSGYVHFCINPPFLWANAQWDPTSHVMRYGDGGSGFLPLTALDICAHEIGHGICQYTANLSAGSSGTTEADALNEGLSDIWGACVEHYAAPTKQTWLIGEDVVANPTFFSCLRDLQNPLSTTTLEGQHPDTYLVSPWSTAGEPHTNSTVLSHWFYLLVHGGSGTNGLGNAFYVPSIGIDRAQQIVYNAERYHLVTGANYADARNATIGATRDVNGGTVGSCDEFAVISAWYAVGVGACTSCSVTYNFGTLPASVASGNVFAGSSAGTGGSGTVTVSSTGNTVITAKNSITLLPSFQAVVTGAGSFTANIATCGYNTAITASPKESQIATSTILGAEESNPNTSTLPSSGIQVYPSVGSGTVHITGSKENIENAEIVVLDASGKPVHRLHNGTNTAITLGLNYLANGLYFVQIHNNAKVIVQKIIISK